MPIYEYRCDECGHEFETIQKISDDPLKDCPACHETKLVKKISAAGFRLKGGGWYETDFKSGEKRNLTGSSDSRSSESGSASDGSSTSSSSEKPKSGNTSETSAESSSGSSKSSEAC